MDSRIIGVVVFVCAILVVVGVYIGNSNNNGTSNLPSNVITTNLPSDNNSTTNSPSSQIQSPNNLPVTVFSHTDWPVNPSDPSPDLNPGRDLYLENILKLYDSYVESTFAKSGVPGATIAIVQNGKVVYMKCLGVRNLATRAPVTPDTLFEIGSCSKAFSATNVAQQVDKGLMSWDDPVIKFFNPTLFQLYSPYVTKSITIRDALCHRSGYPEYAGDTQWFLFNDSYNSMVYKLRYIKNDTVFRSTYNYNNIIYALGGYSAANVHQTSWYNLIKKELLNPLGMYTATTRYSDFLKSPNHATSYLYLGNGSIIPCHVSNLDAVGPAGNLGCSVNNMVNWLKFQIADTGMYNGIRIVSKKNLDETKTGQIKTHSSDELYCLGWERAINSNPNKFRIYHGGDTTYSKTFVEVFPLKKLGIVIMTNAGQYGQAYRDSMGKKFNDLLQGNYYTNPWPQFKELNKPRNIPDPNPPIIKPKALTTYTGTYHNSFYGNIKIISKKNSLYCYYGKNKQPYKLSYWNNDIFNDPTHSNQFGFTNIYKGKSHQLTTYVQNYSTAPAGPTSEFKRIK